MKMLLKSLTKDQVSVKMYESEGGFGDMFLTNQVRYTVEAKWADSPQETWNFGFLTESGADVRFTEVVEGYLPSDEVMEYPVFEELPILGEEEFANE